jgi:hypothetical protein
MGQNSKNILIRAYNKFYLRSKFQRERNKSFGLFLREFDYDIEDYDEIVEEIINDKEFNESVNKEFTEAGVSSRFPYYKISWPYFTYYLIRKTKPEKIVETGVWYGVSSSIILNALNRNEKGNLYSIDLPAYFETGGYTDENPYLEEKDRTSSLPPGRNPGFIIPEYLKKRWKLILGDSKIFLPKTFEELNNVDIFLHDSLHSYDNMIFEFDLASKYVRSGGFILSDNIDWHNAFYDFCKKQKLIYKTFLAYFESKRLKHNFGAIRI